MGDYGVSNRPITPMADTLWQANRRNKENPLYEIVIIMA